MDVGTGPHAYSSVRSSANRPLRHGGVRLRWVRAGSINAEDSAWSKRGGERPGRFRGVIEVSGRSFICRDRSLSVIIKPSSG